MEFQYRAGDARARSPSRSTGAAATSANSESAATRVRDDYGGDRSGYDGESSEALAPRPASDPDELRRQAAKERIRERILREEAETLALEAEVRRELIEELRSQLARSAGASAKGSEAKATPAAHPPSLKTQIPREVGSKPDMPAALPAKRKIHHVPAASNVSAATSSKKLKPDLTCTVCSITATSETAMQEHLKGKSHGRKTAKLALPLTGAGQHEVSSKINGSAAWPAEGENPNMAVAPTVFAATSSNEQKSDLTCTVCGITSTSQKAMQDHLEGKLHRKKAAMLPQPMPKDDVASSKPNASAAALNGIMATGEKGMQDHFKGKAHMSKAAALAQPPREESAEHGCQEEAEEEGAYMPKIYSIGTGSGNSCEVVQMSGFLLCEVCNVKVANLVTMACHVRGRKHISKAKQKEEQGRAMEVNGVRRVDGFLLCELCDVKTESETVMRTHLSGKKHTSKQKAAVDAGACGKTVLAQEITNEDVALGASVDITVTPGQQPNQAAGTAAAVVGDSSKMEVVPSATPREDGAAPVCASFSVAPMEVDEYTEAGDRTAKAEEKLDAEEEEAVETNGIAAVSANEFKIQVEGKLCIVLQQADGSFSCGLCNLHGCRKYDMVDHLYTPEHLHRARLSEQKEEQAKKAAPAVVSNDSDGVVIPFADGAAQVEN
ncbi:uncharacterized protein [Lolium perenne]|uniref:uncharacterized protein n=1 Tax=Lolium perenne TaxID=4522 RepID=UPI0021F53A35|nr:uncharacterized protein LOC127303851 [Lolium perenne]